MTVTTGAPPLHEVLANRRWVRRSRPFAHVVAQNVFTPDFYAELDAEYHRIQDEHAASFVRNMVGYDASGVAVGSYRDGPLGVFLTREWHDLLAGLGGVDGAVGDMTVSLHHHDPGGASGWPHNDLNPGWFADPPAAPGEVRVAGDDGGEYHHGTRPEGQAARETVRAVSALFYLGNPEWEPGDGGETGLYDGPTATRPAAAVPPINNSLVLFECTPYSWHGFLTNRVKPRNSVVMWVHRPKDDVVRRWQERSIVEW